MLRVSETLQLWLFTETGWHKIKPSNCLPMITMLPLSVIEFHVRVMQSMWLPATDMLPKSVTELHNWARKKMWLPVNIMLHLSAIK